jgi:hypothetical protein
MKNKIAIGLAALLLACGVRAQAQYLTNNGIVYAPVATPSTNGSALSLAASTLWANVKSATNYAIAPYATYAPKAPTKWGGGVLAIYNVSQYFGGGAGIDWLGGFNLVSGDIQLKLPTHPLSALGGNWATFEATPFVIGGIGTPFSGAGTANGGISTIEDVGLQFKFGHLWGGQFGVEGTYGKWQGAGPYDVARYHAAVSWQKGF